MTGADAPGRDAAPPAPDAAPPDAAGTRAWPQGRTLAVVVCRSGRLPAGADEATAEAGGRVVLAGDGTLAAAAGLPSARVVWCLETGPEAPARESPPGPVGPAALAAVLAPLVAGATLVVLPASPDGRDLAPRLAATLGRPVLAGAIRVAAAAGGVRAELLRADGRVAVPVECPGPAVATLMPGARAGAPAGGRPAIVPVDAARVTDRPERARRRTDADLDPEVLAVVAPDPATMDLSDATRVLGGGAGLVPTGASDARAGAIFDLLGRVARTLGASAGATRVVTDAGWLPYDRQIGTTGVAIDPDLYVALGVSGASQHTGGLGAPRHTVSVNVDPSCPMTAMADLGVVTDALSLLVELAGRLGVDVPPEVKDPDA